LSTAILSLLNELIRNSEHNEGEIYFILAVLRVGMKQKSTSLGAARRLLSCG